MAGLFPAVGELLRHSLIKKDDGIADRQTILGAAEAKDIDARFHSQPPRRDIQGGHGVGEAAPSICTSNPSSRAVSPTAFNSSAV